MKESRRARRIRHTRRIVAHRRSEYTHRILGGDASGPRWVEISPNYWAKVGIGRCDCRKRRKGAPRLDCGMCDLGSRTRIYLMRTLTRELDLAVRRGMDLDGDEVALLSHRGEER